MDPLKVNRHINKNSFIKNLTSSEFLYTFAISRRRQSVQDIFLVLFDVKSTARVSSTYSLVLWVTRTKVFLGRVASEEISVTEEAVHKSFCRLQQQNAFKIKLK